jgi:CRISPR-associated protein Cas1
MTAFVGRPALSIRRHVATLRLTRRAAFRFNHGGVIRGLVSAALGQHEMPGGVIPFACESGRVRFEEGDLYKLAFTLVGDPGVSVGALGEGLARVGRTRARPAGPPPTLGGNFTFESLETLPDVDVDAMTREVAARERLTFRFLSPYRQERPPELTGCDEGFLGASCFPAAYFLRRLWSRLFFLATGRYPTKAEEALAGDVDGDGVEAIPGELLWLDVPVEGRPEPPAGRTRGYTVGGVVGSVELRGELRPWAEALACGQLVHVGKNTHFGFGRYVIDGLSASASEGFGPARTALSRVSEPRLLEEALAHVAKRSDAAGVDGVRPGDPGVGDASLPATLSAELTDGSYRPGPLLGFLVGKASGGVRPLAIPTLRDRVVQRAACDVLAPAVDGLLDVCSFAYRKGLSRAGAARAIQKAWEDGYRWVLDADIESFFDSVPWNRLFGKLEALLPMEPLVAVLKGWVTSSVVFQGRTLPRTQGLPQGAAISPLLANLYLDELDDDLLGHGYRLVRYADDFVVLCKDLETAKKAREDARAVLERLGLSLNETKTSTASLEDGLRYLGYLFCRSVVLDSPGSGATSAADGAPRAVVPAASWLAQVPFERVRALVDGRAPRIGGPAVAPVRLVERPTPPGAPATRPLYVSSPACRLELNHETLVVSSPGEASLTLPIRGLSHVVFIGHVRATVPLLLALNAFGVPAFFCRRSGELAAAFDPHAPDWNLWVAQGKAASDPVVRLDTCRAIVAAKLHNYATTAIRLGLDDAHGLADDLRALERAAANKSTLEAVRGLEGKGAALWFSALARSLAFEWRFAGRERRPPADPVNAMLSMGYGLLHNHVHTSVVAAGLHPRIGFLHEERGAHAALASDLQEELRHIADACALAMIHRREVRRTDFVPSADGRYPCLMADDLRRRFIAEMEKRLATLFTPAPGAEAVSYRQFMDAQARQVKDLVLGRRVGYEPLRVHG